MQDFTIRYYRVNDILPTGAISGLPSFVVPHCYRQVLCSNPFRDGRNVVAVKVGVVDGKVAGSEYVFPLLMKCDGRVVAAGGGSTTTVEKWARKSGLGAEISEMMPDRRDGDFDVGFGVGMSQRAVLIHRMLGCSIFEYPRFVLLLKSRSVLEGKLSGWTLRVTSRIVDLMIACYAKLVAFIALVACGKVRAIKVDPGDDSQIKILEGLAQSNNSRFCELHDAAWFKWVLNNSLSADGPANAYLIYASNAPVGFFMVKKRFHEQASHRGFKNVWLGSVIEWDAKAGYASKVLWSILRWALKARKDLDAVEFPVYELFAQKFLRRLGWQHVGDANFSYKIRPGSDFDEPAGMNDPSNWRLRPGMGDCALN